MIVYVSLLQNNRAMHSPLSEMQNTIGDRVKTTGEVAPRSHNLIYLSENAGLTYDNDTLIFLGILMKYQLQGRYPDYNPVLPDLIRVNEYYDKTKNLLQWLKMKL